MEKADVLAEICAAIDRDDLSGAQVVLAARYPHVPTPKTKRQYSVQDCMRVFVRDGFVDRYSGERLVFPAALRLLSRILGDAFPVHKNWKMEETRCAYWELFPTIDHVQPVAQGGADADENWVTTSMLHNSVKAHWTLSQLKWSLYPPGNVHEWDGLAHWALRQFERGQFSDDEYISRWCRAAATVLAGKHR
ncbi:MAG: HNH endonuclease [Magnetospirillum sp.]|nr:HNH endonuclease [Magnetospirillum sp.]